MLETEAKAAAVLKIAQAEAKAAELMGAVYEKYPSLVKLKMEEARNKVLAERAVALGKALSMNKAVMMPENLQRELAMLEKGFSPIAPVAFFIS